jgi:CRP-like cAMP-binding protein
MQAECFESMIEKNDTVLRKTPLFANLMATEMGTLAGRVNKRHFDRGALFFSEGDPCMGLFLVALGKIRIFKLGGREQVLAWSRAAHSQSFRSLMEVIIRPRRLHWRSAS